MKTITRTVNLPVIVLLLVIVAMASFRAGANRNALAPQPVRLATIDLKQVFDNLDQKGDADVSLGDLARQLEAEGQAKDAEIRALAKQAEEAGDTSQGADLLDRAKRRQVEFQAWYQFNKNKLDVEKALVFQNLYRSIRREARALADAEGYDVVMVDDSKGELTVDRNAKIPMEVQIQQQISARRVIFARDAVDITDALIQRMNNAFNAGTATTP